MQRQRPAVGIGLGVSAGLRVSLRGSRVRWRPYGADCERAGPLNRTAGRVCIKHRHDCCNNINSLKSNTFAASNIIFVRLHDETPCGGVGFTLKEKTKSQMYNFQWIKKKKNKKNQVQINGSTWNRRDYRPDSEILNGIHIAIPADEYLFFNIPYPWTGAREFLHSRVLFCRTGKHAVHIRFATILIKIQSLHTCGVFFLRVFSRIWYVVKFLDLSARIPYEPRKWLFLV